MKIIEKISRKAQAPYENRQPVIAFTGDSVTQGCFEVYTVEAGKIDTVYKPDQAYAEKVKAILSHLFPRANITVVNAGISGSNAPTGARRLQEDVLSLNPDLTVVSYGLNDFMRKQSGLEDYKNGLRKIFRDLREAGSEIIFLTPNLSANRLDYSIQNPTLLPIAQSIVNTVQEGWLDVYMDAARAVCRDEDVPLCDCYAQWKRLHACGVDTTALLSNKLNHPTPQMHWLFAHELVKMMFEV